MNPIVFLSLLLLLLSACQPQSKQSQSKQSSSTLVPVANQVAQPSTSSQIAESLMISADGIGQAKLGMTLGELKQIAEPNTYFELVAPFLVDANAIAVSQEGLVQYYILFPAGSTTHPDGSTPTDQDMIKILLTDNQNYQTPEGVRVGTSIKQAEDIYGNAVLAYNLEGESKEYITFGQKNPHNLRFRASFFKLISDGLGFSGIYPDYPGVSHTTSKYQAEAAIAAIEVACQSDDCL